MFAKENRSSKKVKLEHASRTVVTLLALALVAATLGVPSSAGASLRKTGPVEVTLYGGKPDIGNLNTNWLTKLMEKKFGLSFNFQLSADVATQEPLVFASGHYPDVIWDGDISNSSALQYASEGILVPLNSLLKKYAPNVWKFIQSTPSYRQAVTAPNGKIYGLDAYGPCLACSWTGGSFVDLKYLNEFHLRMPRTTQQFAHVLAVFKQHGLVPMAGSPQDDGGSPVTFLMNAFIPYNGTDSYLDVKNGKVIFVPSQPQWRAGLEYIHGLYTKGYFSKTVFTQQASAVSSLIANQKVGVVPCAGIELCMPLYTTPSAHYNDWFSIPALKGPKGVQSAAANTGVSDVLSFAITKASSQVQRIRIARMLNWMWTIPGDQEYNYGPEGTFWTPAKKGMTGPTGIPARYVTSAGQMNVKVQNESWYQWGPWHDSSAFRSVQYTPGPYAPHAVGDYARDILEKEVSYAGHQAPEQYPTVWLPSSELQTVAAEETNINNYVDKWTAEFIVGQKSLSSDWNNYLSGLKALQLGHYVKISQEAMHHRPLILKGVYWRRLSGTIQNLVCESHTPALVQKYLIQSGVPASDFQCKTGSEAHSAHPAVAG